MKLTRRPYAGEADYWRLRAFLREVYGGNDRHEWSWPLYRWDYWRWHVHENVFQHDLPEVVFIWETAQGEVAAFINPDGPGHVHLQVHPAARSRALEAEMLAVAEERLATPLADRARQLHVWAHESDDLRQALLAERGYTRREWEDRQRRRALAAPLPTVALPDGYRIRALGGDEELPARSWCSWRAFHPDDPDDAYEGWEWYRNVQRAPLYRRQLDLVAAAPGGALGAFCTVWFDDANRVGSFEPVGTAPEHQRRGLGKAVIAEGLRRLQRLGATLATVNSSGMPGHALYASMGFTAFDLQRAWTKRIGHGR